MFDSALSAPPGLERTETGYLRVTPSPSVETLATFYREKYFQAPCGSYQVEYSSEELEFFGNAAWVANVTVASRPMEHSLLDLGCGEGFFAAKFLDLGWSVACCDWSSYGIERFNPVLLPCFTQHEALDMLYRVRRENRRFGMVNLQNVLEHVLSPESLLTELKAAIAPGGVVRIRVPNDFSAFQEELLSRGLTSATWVCAPEHLNYFNAQSLVSLLQHQGYEVFSLQCNFPVEVFLLNEHANYALDRSKGRAAHMARVSAENFLVAAGVEAYVAYAEAAAGLGFGRELIAYAAPRS
ncbi:MAG: class I SAM-dependent methyltransferase [Pseudomonadota bacterium]